MSPRAAARWMVTPPRRHVPIDKIREAARLSVEASSLRRTARAVGMSPTGLQGFLGGSEPYGPTIQKLQEWYVREESRKPAQLTQETARAAVWLLVRHLPEPQRDRAVQRILEALAAESDGAGLPAWLDALREDPPEGPPEEPQ